MFARADAVMVWLRLDGQRGAGNPLLTQQFQTDHMICFGTALDDDKVVCEVEKGCMAQKGHIHVPEDQAEAKLQELAAANAQKSAAALSHRKIPGP